MILIVRLDPFGKSPGNFYALGPISNHTALLVPANRSLAVTTRISNVRMISPLATIALSRSSKASVAEEIGPALGMSRCAIE